MDKPDALRLAGWTQRWSIVKCCREETANELRRLHKSNIKAWDVIHLQQVEFIALRKQRDALLEALKRIDDMCAAPPNFSGATMQEIARAAIKAAEEQK
jgi:hypothetical protein